MGKTNTYRPSTVIQRVTSTVPAATANYTVDLPAGLYYLALAVKSSITGTTTTIAVTPWADAAQSQISGVPFRMTEPDDVAVIALLTLPAGAAGRWAQLLSNASGVVVPGPIAVPHGIQVGLVKGTAVEGELLEIDLVAVRIG